MYPILNKEKCDICNEEECICDIEEGISYVDVERWDDICDRDNEFDEYLKGNN